MLFGSRNYLKFGQGLGKRDPPKSPFHGGGVGAKNCMANFESQFQNFEKLSHINAP